MATCPGTPRPPRNLPRRWRLVTATLVVSLLGLLAATPAHAQSAVGGIVKDLNGRVVVGAQVTVRDLASRREWHTVSSTIGSYEVAPLPPGRYTVRVETEFYQPFVETVELVRHVMARLDVPLVYRVTETVTVRGDARPLQPLGMRDLSFGTTFTREAIESLPLTNGRTVQSMQLFAAGLTFTDSVGTLAQFTAGGQRRFSNRMQIDGVSADLAVDVSSPGIGAGSAGNLPAFATSGGTQTLVPMEAIDEIAVRTTGASAEYASAPGAITSILTRAGGNRFSGTAFAGSRPNGLTAANWLANAGQTPERRADFWNAGVSAGGPLIRDRLFFFTTFERQALDRSVQATIDVPSMAVRDSASPAARRLLDAFPRPNGPETSEGFATYSGKFPATSRLWTLSHRVDATLSPAHRMFTRVNLGRSSGDAMSLQVQVPFFTARRVEQASTNTVTLGLDSTWASVTHALRANVSTHGGSAVSSPAGVGGASPLPTDLLLPGAAPRGFINMVLFPGEGGFVVDGPLADNRQRQLQFTDTWSWAWRAHEWKFGADYRRLDADARPGGRLYLMRFNGVTNLLNGRLPAMLVRETQDTSARFQSLALFAQDTYRPTPRWTFNYGLRYRVQPAPANVEGSRPVLVRYDVLPDVQTFEADRLWKQSWRDAGVRAAAAYQLGERPNRETIVRAGWGLSFDDSNRVGAATFSGGPYVSDHLVTGMPFPVTPEALARLDHQLATEAGTSELYAYPDDFRSPRTYEWQASVEQALGPHQRLAIAYVGAAGRDLPYWHGYYVLPQTRAVQAYSNDATSDYQALLVDYTRRLSKGFQARAAYTWSHAIDTDSGESRTPLPPPEEVAPASNRGAADFDRRHILQFAISYQLPALAKRGLLRALSDGFQLDLLGTWRTGGPFDVLSARSLTYGSYALRPDLVPSVPLWLDDPTVPSGRRVNPAAFAEPREARQGTLGRNTLRASPLHQIDLALVRTLRFGHQGQLQIRLDAFNVFNVPALGPPNGSLTDEQFGRPFQSYAETLGTGTLANGGLTPLQQVGGPRSLQLGLRVAF